MWLMDGHVSAYYGSLWLQNYELLHERNEEMSRECAEARGQD